jgi:uncharacterized protein YndB with AHSA1/START domain
MAKSIKHNFFFPQQPEAVWEYLTKPELMAQWLMETDFQPIVGCDFQFKTRPMPNFNFDGIVYCKVLEIMPYKRLSYSWKGGPGEGKITLDSIVVWTLHPKDNGTELQLDHSGFKEADFMMYSIMNDGWLQNIQKIAELLNTAKHGAANA